MKRILYPMLLLIILSACITMQEKILPVPNGGFEEQLKDWKVSEKVPMSSVSTEQAFTGNHSLKVVDRDMKDGSWVIGFRVPVAGQGAFELRGMYYPVSGSGLGMYVHVLDKDYKYVVPADTFQLGMGGTSRK